MSREDDVAGYFAATVEHFGRVDALHNNAGIEGPLTPLADFATDQFERLVAINYVGMFLNLREMLRCARQAGSAATIVNTASGTGLHGVPGLGAYGSTKAAIIGLTRAAAIENAAAGIRVNAVAPGPVDTALFDRFDQRVPGAGRGGPAGRAAGHRRRGCRPGRVPAQRRGPIHHRRGVPHRRGRDGVSSSVDPREAVPADNPADLGIIGAAALLRERRLSARELTEACLARIDERNGGAPSFDGDPDAINAWVRLYPDVAREAAAAADARREREGADAPLLCGIPIGLKDLYGVAGLPLTASGRVLDGNVAAADAAVWARLRDQGMVLLGHTHTHEFAAGGTTDQVGNPWARHRVAGGSSGGSAAAVAAGMTPAALGSDTCGSLRIPSACCGTSAIKPTHGLLPLAGIIPLAPSLDHPGPMARTIADCSALLTGMLRGGPAISAVAPPPAPLGELPTAPAPGARPLAGVTIALTDRTDAVADRAGDRRRARRRPPGLRSPGRPGRLRSRPVGPGLG